ncbi:Do family serine endopeptidase [Methylocystis parvus OBBP]|uniref:Probable periplasmic serine endoprotease DegP-like n=2 Tax=Methylocystis parvus TaxID=134 RepID=A0A6B8MB87_9HYPH|nr:Do family serine endopeptidase [Methylocystis parvus]QGM99695.1 Do family serine endopeptidase [Methylocystis parvus]WBK02038.1 Do family serine endopeptidase [Methylocystis parvus OBBP]
MGAAAALAFGASVGAPIRPAFAEAPSSVSVAPMGPASFADVVDHVKGAVVAIKVKGFEESQNPFEGQGELSPDDPMYKFFKRFGETPQKRMTQSQGSGFIISPDGYVVTNNHVVEHANEVEVALEDGRTLTAKVIGTDKRTDLALLKVNDGNKLPHVEWASAQPRVGDWVIAVGNPFGLGGSVTAGIVSARGRDIGAGPYDDFLQIDAPVNRGNSGGPAFDTRGNVVGVNTAIYSPSGGSVGIGFAIPAEVAKDVVAALKDKGAVSRGWIGVKIQQVTPEIAESLGLKSSKGALIAQPQKGAPADAAGLKAGDVITAVNGEKIETPRELARKIAAMGPNKSIDLTFVRNGSEKSAKLTLGKLPEEREARADDEDTGATGHASVASLGVEVAPASEVRGAGGEGLYVTDIDPNGAAAQKGLRRGDVIVEVGGQAVNSRADLSNAIDGARKEGRRSVLLRVKSADGAKFIAVPVRQSAG